MRSVRSCAAAALLWAAAFPFSGLAAESGSVHLAVFRRTHFTLSMPIIDPFERLLREEGFKLRRVDNIPSSFNGDVYDFSLPDPEETPGGEVEILETSTGFFAFLPADEWLMDLFQKLARDPGSYPDKRVPWTRRRQGELLKRRLPDGRVQHTLLIRDPESVRYPQSRDTLATVYKIFADGTTHEAVFLHKTLGGEGRTAAALKRLRGSYGKDLLVLNRGEIFVYGASVTTGTAAGHRFEQMGVQAAAIGGGELSRLSDLFAYRSASGSGSLSFLSANLVYSSDTAKSVFPPYRIFNIRQRRVAVLGLTRRALSKFLGPEDAKRFSLKDPLGVARNLVPELRTKADVVIVLSNLRASDHANLRRQVRGIDLIVGDTFKYETETSLPTVKMEDLDRGPFDAAMLISGDAPTVLTHLDLRHRRLGSARYALSVGQSHILLDESLPDIEGYVKFNPAVYGVQTDTRPAILPAVRKLYADKKGATAGYTRMRSGDFWRLAASLAADSQQAEAAFLPIFNIPQRTAGDFRETLVREWFRFGDELMVLELPGSALKQLISAASAHKNPNAEIPVGGMRIAAGGIGPGGTVHGVGVDSRAVYRVVVSGRIMAQTGQFSGLKSAKHARRVGLLRDIVLRELRRCADEGWSIERYRKLLQGLPIRETGMWKVNFREISVSVSNTKVVADSAFSNVPNARVRGFDELLIGGGLKVDAEYYGGPLKWTNSAELAYSKSRLSPPGQTVILNTPQNRTSLLTTATRKVGAFPWSFLARSFGPSLGMQYEGHVEKLPDQRRKHIVSVYPGVELFNGTFFNSIELSGNLRRDFTPITPINAFGFRLRALFSKPLPFGRVQGESRTNYFVRTPQDTSQDLRLESNLILKVHLPVWRNISLAPFFDLDYFILKIRPISGYSAIMGVSLNFSRLWKPQYESF